MGLQTIPIAKPSLTNRERRYLLDAYDSGYVSAKGGFITRFEDEFAHFHGSKRAISCSNGTSALHLALLSLGIGRDCEVIIPSLTFIATKNVVIYSKAVPVVVEVDPDTLCIDVEKVERAISVRTRAIIAVHLYGNPCEMKKLLELCTKYRIHLIEDSAQAFGSRYGDKYCGSMGTIGCFSFYGNKTITTGQGGMIITQSDIIADRIRHLENQAMIYPYHHNMVGYNYRMTNLEAAIGLAQVERADELIKKKLHIHSYYRRYLKDMAFQKSYENTNPVFWMTVIKVEDRNEFMNHLNVKGIETRPCFEPMNENMLIQKKLSEQWVCLPSGPDINNKELKYIVEVINDYRTHR
jgi:perosamine synthetase